MIRRVWSFADDIAVRSRIAFRDESVTDTDELSDHYSCSIVRKIVKWFQPEAFAFSTVEPYCDKVLIVILPVRVEIMRPKMSTVVARESGGFSTHDSRVSFA